MLRAAVGVAAATGVVIVGVAGAATPGAPTKLEKGTVRVAVIAQGGAAGAASRLVSNGAVVAAERINARGGIGGRVRIDLRRVPLRTGTSATALMRGLDRAGTRVVILPCAEDRQQELADAASQSGILALAPCNDLLRPAPPRFVWPVGPTVAEQVAMLATYGASQNAQRAFLLGTDRRSAVEDRAMALLRVAVGRSLTEVVGSGSIRPDARDAAAVVKRIKASRAVVVYTTLSPPAAQAAVKGLRRAGFAGPIYLTDRMDAAVPRRYPARPFESVAFVTYGFARPSARAFVSDYRKRFKTPPRGSYPGLGYETMRLAELAAIKARSVAPADLDARLQKGLLLIGVALGDTTYPGNGVRRPIRDVGIARVIRGAYSPEVSSRPSPSVVPGS